jgi:formimidoylglutamate deiminase
MAKLLLDHALLPGGWAERVVAAVGSDGRFASVEPGGPADGAERRPGVAVPGVPNLHSHAFQRGMAGLAEVRGPADDTFWTWREVMYRFLARLTPDDVEAVAAQLYVEMLEAGFTAVGEFHYLHHDADGRAYADAAEMAARVAAASAEAGIGLTLLPCLYAQGGFGGAPPTEGQRRFVNDPDGFARIVGRCRAIAAGLDDAAVGVAPHSLRAVTPEGLRAAAALAPDGPVHVHAAEQVREVEDCLAWSGRRPVGWLLGEMPVDARWCLIHATHVTPDESAALARSGAVAGLCPVTEANLGDGVFPAAPYLDAGGRIGIGSDSNVQVGAAAELRQLEYAQRLAHRGRNLLAGGEGRSTGRRLLDATLAGGAQALGRRIGAIAPGRRADLVLLDPEHPALVGRSGDAWLDAWVFAGDGGPVREVWCGGRRVVEDGRHVRREAVRERFRATMRGLLAA